MPSGPRAREGEPTLIRAMGRWTLAALTLNSIIGSGIYGVPGEAIRLVGSAAPLATVVAAIGVGAIMACFAEVGSQFRDPGGPYLYTREAFGRLAGIQIGWMALLVRITAHAAIANLLVTYAAEFMPGVIAPWPRAAVLVSVLGTLAAINITGVAGGARLSNVVTITKLVPLVGLATIGLLLAAPDVPAPTLAGSAADWTQAVLLLIFAFGGFESALIPVGEVRDPRRDVPFALGVALVVCAVLYTAIHLVVLAVPSAAASPRAVAEAARALFGPTGATVMALGAVLSIVGILSAGILNTPRLFYALAAHGDFPGWFAVVHARFRTPWVALLTYTGLVCVLALTGGFVCNAVLSAVGRLLTYGAVCLALLRLRHLRPNADAHRAWGGPFFAVLGLLFCVGLVARMGRAEFLVLAAASVLAGVNWWWVTRRVT